ncbi:hypothetical protein H9P43_000300 [Blastocladiella emersonii ATCC 22665]|nr:hypothetical protein H9P43_000300 [Blastocladiella emersonii ATCC 22665]
MNPSSAKRAKTAHIDYDREPREEDYRAMEAWLLREGADLSNVTIRKSATSEGYGIYAAHAISPGTTVAAIPSHVILSEHDALASSLGRAFLAYNATVPVAEYAAGHVCTKTILWLFIVHEFFVRGEGSRWWPYLRALPRTFDTPLFWTDDELAVLQGTNLHFVVQEKRAELERDFAHAQGVLLDRFPEVWGMGEAVKALTLSNYLWARTVCSSRAFPSDLNLVVQGRAKAAVSADAADPVLAADDTHDAAVAARGADGVIPPCKCHLALWPLFDMLNHQRGSSMTWDATRGDGVAFITGAAMAEGEEVFNSYGPKGNDELLLSYGFCLDLPNNPDEYVPLKPNFAADPAYPAKRAVLDAHGLVPYKDLYLIRHTDPAPAALIAALRIIVANPRELESAKSAAPRAPVSTRNELTLWDTLVSLLAAKRDAVAPITGKPDASFRARMAAIYRNGQAAVLDAALDHARSTFASLVAEAAPGILKFADLAADAEFWAVPAVEALVEQADEEWEVDDWALVYVLWAHAEGRLPEGVEFGDDEGDDDPLMLPLLTADDAVAPLKFDAAHVRRVHRWMGERMVALRNVQVESGDDEDEDDEEEEEATEFLGIVLA